MQQVARKQRADAQSAHDARRPDGSTLATAEQPATDGWLERTATALDRAIYRFAPRWGARRLEARRRFEQQEQLAAFSRKRLEALGRNYWDGAESDRHRGEASWMASRLSPDSGAELSLEKERLRAQELYRTNGWVASYINSLPDYVVGTGRRPKPLLRALSGVLTDAQAKKHGEELLDVFNRWKCYAGVHGESLAEIQRRMCRQRGQDGECFAIFRDVGRATSPIPLAIQIVSADYVSTPPEFSGDLNVRMGIRFDDKGNKLGIYVRRAHPYDIRSKERDLFVWDFVPWLDKKGLPRVVHHYKKVWEGQSRGFPDVAPVTSQIKDLGDYCEAHVIKKQIAACNSVWIENSVDPTDEARASAAAACNGQYIEDFSPGMVRYLYPGQKVSFMDPQIDDALDQFMVWQLRAIAAGLDYPYELLTRHWENSYAGGRLALIDGHRRFKADAWLLDEQLNHVLWMHLVVESLLTGELTVGPSVFEANRERFMESKWLGDPLPWIEPDKEVEAAAKAIALGVDTQRNYLESRGWDWDQFWAERKEHGDALDAIDKPLLVPAGWNPDDANEIQLGKDNTAQRVDKGGKPKGGGGAKKPAKQGAAA